MEWFGVEWSGVLWAKEEEGLLWWPAR